MTRLVWVKVYRGRVWHVQDDQDTTWCDKRDLFHERQRDKPPEGGQVCESCARNVAVFADKVNGAAIDGEAWEATRQAQAEGIDPDAPLDLLSDDQVEVVPRPE